MKNIKSTIIFYEAPHRINETLIDMAEILGNNRKLTISREITKLYEEIYRGTIREIIEKNVEFKGELVVVVEGNNEIKDFSMTLIEHINLYIEEGKSSKDAIKIVAKERNLKKSEVYDEYLKYQGK